MISLALADSDASLKKTSPPVMVPAPTFNRR